MYKLVTDQKRAVKRVGGSFFIGSVSSPYSPVIRRLLACRGFRMQCAKVLHEFSLGQVVGWKKAG